jgi:hypothetical protein
VIIVAGCLHCAAQTNCAKPTLFLLPEIELRPLASQSETAAPELQYRARTNSLWELSLARPNADAQTNAPITTAEFTSDFTTTSLEREVYDKLERGGYLTRQDSGSDIPMVRWLGSTFEPAVFHIGKVSVCCSLVTAIKNRNPLCLLNPMVLGASW